MRKLSKLKQWLTIGDAAQHLSIVFGETVNEADVLRLGLDGHLKLSVHFVNHTEARVGNAIPIAEAKTALSVFRTEGEEPHHIVLGIVLNDREVLNLAEDIITLDGVWDLSMIGNESLDVEHAYQNLTGGPAVTLTCLDGAFVQREDGKIFQLQSRFDEEHYKKDSKLPWGHPSFYYPAGGLPKDSVLVVRMTALAEFEKTFHSTQGKNHS